MGHVVLVIGDSRVSAGAADGAALGVACGLAERGVETHLLTRLGNDFDGATIWKRVKDSGARLVGESFGFAPTSTAERVSRERAWDLPLVRDVAPTWVHVESSPWFSAPRSSTVVDYLDALPADTGVSYSPAVDPSASSDRAAALAQFEEVAHVCDVVILSQAAAGWLYPGLSEEFVTDAVLSLGVRVVALSGGPSGAVISTDANTVHLAAPVDAGTAADFSAALILPLLADSRPSTVERLHDIGRRAAATLAPAR